MNALENLIQMIRRDGRNLVVAEFKQRDRHLQRRIDKMLNAQSSRVFSDAEQTLDVLNESEELCIDELEKRAAIAWEKFKEVLFAHNIDSLSAGFVKGEIQWLITLDVDGLNSQVYRVAKKLYVTRMANVERGLEVALNNIYAQVDQYFQKNHMLSSTEVTPEQTSEAMEKIRYLWRRFPVIASHFNRRRDNRPTIEISDEHDVQYLLNALLCVFFEDVRPEASTPSYAGKSSRVDFLLKDESIALEVKVARNNRSDKELGKELIDDISRYRQMPECNILVFLIYDPGYNIKNPSGLKSDLSKEEREFSVEILYSPER